MTWLKGENLKTTLMASHKYDLRQCMYDSAGRKLTASPYWNIVGQIKDALERSRLLPGGLGSIDPVGWP